MGPTPAPSTVAAPGAVAAPTESRNVIESEAAVPHSNHDGGLDKADLNRALGFLLALILSAFGWWLARVDSRVAALQSAQSSTDRDVARLDGEVRAELRSINVRLGEQVIRLTNIQDAVQRSYKGGD